MYIYIYIIYIYISYVSYIFHIFMSISLYTKKRKKNFVSCSYLKLVRVKSFDRSSVLEFLMNFIMSKS